MTERLVQGRTDILPNEIDCLLSLAETWRRYWDQNPAKPLERERVQSELGLFCFPTSARPQRTFSVWCGLLLPANRPVGLD